MNANSLVIHQEYFSITRKIVRNSTNSLHETIFKLLAAEVPTYQTFFLCIHRSHLKSLIDNASSYFCDLYGTLFWHTVLTLKEFLLRTTALFIRIVIRISFLIRRNREDFNIELAHANHWIFSPTSWLYSPIHLYICKYINLLIKLYI